MFLYQVVSTQMLLVTWPQAVRNVQTVPLFILTKHQENKLKIASLVLEVTSKILQFGKIMAHCFISTRFHTAAIVIMLFLSSYGKHVLVHPSGLDPGTGRNLRLYLSFDSDIASLKKGCLSSLPGYSYCNIFTSFYNQ